MPDSPRFHQALRWEMPLSAPPERVFPLLCPVLETLWIPGWKADILRSESGVAELGCVFRTLEEDGRTRVWVVTRYEPEAGRIHFAQFVPDLCVLRLEIGLEPRGSGCLATWTHIVDGLRPEADPWFEAYGEEAHRARMTRLGGLLEAHLSRSVPAGAPGPA